MNLGVVNVLRAVIKKDKIEVSSTGTMLIRNIVMPFDAYLQKIPEEKRRFSKTV